MIVMWYGSLASIPSGFVLCDGTNGTPDLRDNFVMPAGGSHNPNDPIADPRHEHNFTSDLHSHEMQLDFPIAAGANISKDFDDKAITGTTLFLAPKPPYHALVYIMQT